MGVFMMGIHQYSSSHEYDMILMKRNLKIWKARLTCIEKGCPQFQLFKRSDPFPIESACRKVCLAWNKIAHTAESVGSDSCRIASKRIPSILNY